MMGTYMNEHVNAMYRYADNELFPDGYLDELFQTKGPEALEKAVYSAMLRR
jgi:hypothetical protein